jgi:hypothetical protein
VYVKASSFCIVATLFSLIGCCPVITNIAPYQGTAGSQVVIDGERFESTPAGNDVSFGGVSVPSSGILEASANRLKVIVPEGAQSGPVRVSTGYCDGVSPQPFTVLGFALKPDLVPYNLSFDANGALLFEFGNEGQRAVPGGPGKIDFFVDGEFLRSCVLDNLPDQSFRAPGGSVTLDTGLRLAGRNRRIAVVVDPANAIDESNEFQNTLTRSLTPPVTSGPDFIIGDIALETPSRLRVLLGNKGTSDSPTDLSVRFAAWVNDEHVGALDTIVPSIRPNRAIRLTYPIPVPIADGSRVRLSVKTNRLADEIDNTNNSREVILPSGPSLAPYTAILDNPRIRNSINWEARSDGLSQVTLPYDSWSAAQKADLQAAILSREKGGPYPLDAPPDVEADGEISAEDAWSIYLAHVAQTLWVEVNRKVGWRLTSLTDEQLSLLLDGRKLLSFWYLDYSFNTYLLGSVTAWNPRICFEFLDNLGLIKPTQVETIYALTDWMRGHLVHTFSGEDRIHLFDYAGLPPADKMLYALDDRKHKVEGCWGVTGLYAAVLRSINLPVESERIWLEEFYHSRPFFPTVDLGLTHGDDVHNAVLTPSGSVAPSSVMFFNGADMQALFIEPTPDCHEGRCNTAKEQASYNSGRHRWREAYEHMADYLLYQYAYRGAAYLNDSLRGPRRNNTIHEYVKPYFTGPERAGMVQAVAEKLVEIGEGDMEAGKTRVIDRWQRFQGNK